MSVALQSIAKAENRFVWPLATCGGASILALASLLKVLGVSVVAPALVVGAAALLWVAYRHPLCSLGSVLAFMPVFPLAFLLAKYFGPPYIAKLEGFDRVAMLALVFVLWRRNGIKLTAPDWLLLACFGLAVVRFAFDGMLLPLLSDFNLAIAYAAGRVAILSVKQQKLWAKRAVWIIAFLAIVGMPEIFFIGEGPRTVLYVAVAQGSTIEGEARLGNAFRATGFSGMREASTALGPLHFAPLCMMALILWWVYFRKTLPGATVAAGLVCTVTRSAWLGTALAIPFMAIIMGQTKRFFRYGPLALLLFAVSIPVFGLKDYLFATKKGEDPSAEMHMGDIHQAFSYVLAHSLGVGPGKAGRWATDYFGNAGALNVDDTYLTFAAEYGIPTALCFVGFLIASLWVSCKQCTELGYSAAGILVGFGTVMTFFIAHDIFPLACWIWFPIGLAVRSEADSHREFARAEPTLVQPRVDNAVGCHG